jgi:putative tryptophan/tyrosine transport system substrate-binding protein
MTACIGRREFITLLGGAAAAWPLAVRAEQAKMPVIGFLHSASADTFADRLRAFRRGLRETDHVEGGNVIIEYRWAENQPDKLPALAAELVRRQVTIIVAAGGIPSALAAKAATATIPIVFAAGEDPVSRGLVTSIARPGGNVTGINFLNTEVTAKRLGLLRELVPKAARIAVLVNPANASSAEVTLREIPDAARAIGVQIQIFKASNSSEIDSAFAALVRERPDALFIGADPFFNNRRKQLVLQAMRYGLPASYTSREYAEAGGLMSYGTDFLDTYRQVGVYAGRVLRGTKPADLPVVQSAKFELVINQMTARILGLEIPPTLLARADEVIE